MKNVYEFSEQIIYNNNIESCHMDVTGCSRGFDGPMVGLPWNGSRIVFSQETCAECRLVVKDWLEANFADTSAGSARIAGPSTPIFSLSLNQARANRV